MLQNLYVVLVPAAKWCGFFFQNQHVAFQVFVHRCKYRKLMLYRCL